MAVEALTIGILPGIPHSELPIRVPLRRCLPRLSLLLRNGQFNGQPFPVTLATQNASSTNPDSNIDWSEFLPLPACPDMRPQIDFYAEEYTRTNGRSARAVVSAGYVGTQAHRLLVLQERPGDPALCPSA